MQKNKIRRNFAFLENGTMKVQISGTQDRHLSKTDIYFKQTPL